MIPSDICCDMCENSLEISAAKMCRCKMTVYCDENCQIRHWRKHKSECATFQTIFNSMDAPQRPEVPASAQNTSDFNSFINFESHGPNSNAKSDVYKENSDFASGEGETEDDFYESQLKKHRNKKRSQKSKKPPKKTLDAFEDYERKANAGADDCFVLDFKRFNEFAYSWGIKKMLLKFRYDEESLLPFPGMENCWEIKNLDILPPDGTFMLLERSYFKVDSFMSVTFYVDFTPAKLKLRQAQLKASISKKIEPASFMALNDRKEELMRNKNKLEKAYVSSIKRFLQNGVRVRNSFRSQANGLYRFAGHSNSQLKNTSCYLLKASCAEIHQTLHSIGNFEEIQDLGKLVKYIGLLFSTVKSPIMLNSQQWEVEKDIETPDGKYCFTDGCGRISTNLMRQVMGELGLPLHHNTISAVQIRFKGFKGMLVHDPKATKIHFCESMLKFKDQSLTSPIGIINWSRPFMPGYLILHYVMLLSTLGIPDKVFEQKQAIYNNQIRNLMTDPFEAYEFIKYRSPLLAAKFRKRGLSWDVITGLRSLKREELTKFTRNIKTGIKHRRLEEIERVRIFVPKSRNVHGVRDTAGALKYGEVFFRPTVSDGNNRPLRGKIVVGRTPCYSPGDIRVLTCVDPGDAYSHLYDVLVFPTDPSGERPHSDEMSGGDLDGDLYWCCWDPSLIPAKASKPFDYSGINDVIPRGDYEEETNERIGFFAEHDPTLLGIIDALYFEYADRFKANCPECEELNDIFSNVVDCQPSFAKKSMDELRQKLRTLLTKPQNFIWRRIEEENKKLRRELSPNFGVVRKNVGHIKNRAGEKWILEIYTTDFDEPIFLNHEAKYLDKFRDGAIVRFDSKWDSMTNRYVAMNIKEEVEMDISHLTKNLNIETCRGYIRTIYGKIEGFNYREKPLGQIVFRAEYMRQIIEDMDEHEVPLCEAEFNEVSIGSNGKFDFEDLCPGQRVQFNLAYDYRGKLVPMDIDLLEEEEQLEGKEFVKKTSSEKAQIRSPSDMPSALKEKIIRLVKTSKKIAEEDFKNKFCVHYLSKIDPARYGCSSVPDLLRHLGEIKIEFDASGGAYFSLNDVGKTAFYLASNKDKIEKGLSDWREDSNASASDEFRTPQKVLQLKEEDLSTDVDDGKTECFYCQKTGHFPLNCPERGKHQPRPETDENAQIRSAFQNSSSSEEDSEEVIPLRCAENSLVTPREERSMEPAKAESDFSAHLSDFEPIFVAGGESGNFDFSAGTKTSKGTFSSAYSDSDVEEFSAKTQSRSGVKCTVEQLEKRLERGKEGVRYCIDFQVGKNCRYGERCRFSHAEINSGDEDITDL